MVSKAVSAIAVITLAYFWLTYIKRGPVYESEKSLQGKTVLITGGNAGIGKASVIELAKRNARIIVASRNVEKSEITKNEVVKLTGNSKIFVMELDLGSQGSVRSFVKEFKKKEGNLDYLINNAGVFMVNGTTDNGVSKTFNVNHLGHFLLTNLLMDMMKSQAKQRPVRIINVSSDGYRFGSLSKKSIHSNPQSLVEMFISYGDSKLANNLFTLELNRRFKTYGITSYAVHPGFIKTDVGRHMPILLLKAATLAVNALGRDPFYGAQTIMYCVLDDDVVKYSGEYFMDCAHREVYQFAKNESDANFLWEESLKLTGLL